MKYLASYLLLVNAGKTAPTAADVKALMASVGIEAEEERLNSLIAALKEKNIDEVKKSFFY
jgi:large subunit ribosomal protein LP2